MRVGVRTPVAFAREKLGGRAREVARRVHAREVDLRERRRRGVRDGVEVHAPAFERHLRSRGVASSRGGEWRPSIRRPHFSWREGGKSFFLGFCLGEKVFPSHTPLLLRRFSGSPRTRATAPSTRRSTPRPRDAPRGCSKRQKSFKSVSLTARTNVLFRR